MNTQKLRIVMIEDNTADAAFMRTILMEEPSVEISFHWEKRLEDGIKYCRKRRNSVDVVLLDLSLPDSSGIRTLERFTSACADLPVIVLSALSDEELALETLKSGAQDYVLKGQFERTLVLKTIYYAIERQKLTTQLSRQKENLSWIEKRLRTIITSSLDGILVVDKKGFIRFANPSAERLFGRTQKELIGFQFGIPLIKGESVDLEIFNPHQEQAFVELHLVEINWEGTDANLLTMGDITERRKAEEAIRDSEEKFRAIATTATDGIIHLNERNEVVFINDAACHIFNIEERPSTVEPFSLLLKGNEQLLKFIEGKRKISDRLKFEDDQQQNPHEIRVKRVGDEVFPIELSLSFFRRKGRKQTVCIIRDITERKRSEEILVDTRNELKDALSELQNNQERLVEVEKLNSVRELAGAIAHEFSQPLQGLFNYFHLIRNNEPREEYFEKAEQLLNRISDLKNSLTNITSLHQKSYLDSKILDIYASSEISEADKKSNILVVDDEREILETMMDIFNNAGFTCYGASDGTEALEIASGHTFDLIISDVMMQQMNGPELYRQLKKLNYGGKFIFITGYEIEREMEDIVGEVDGVISKPVAFQDLLNSVRYVLNKERDKEDSTV